MRAVSSSANLNRAYKRVKAKGGAPGVDGMTVDGPRDWIAVNRETPIANLQDGGDKPHPLRGVSIPRPGGGERQLGIPTVVDRLVRQAIARRLDPILDPTFSASSFGFRPGRGAHEALRQARGDVADGYDIVVDLDLEKFFDRVNHDIPMSRLVRCIGDKRLLRIVRRFLQAGMMAAGERVMTSVAGFLENELRLKVNQKKSAVAPVGERQCLGHRLGKGPPWHRAQKPGTGQGPPTASRAPQPGTIPGADDRGGKPLYRRLGDL